MQHWIDRSGIAHRPMPTPYSGPQLGVGNGASYCDAAARPLAVRMIRPWSSARRPMRPACSAFLGSACVEKGNPQDRCRGRRQVSQVTEKENVGLPKERVVASQRELRRNATRSASGGRVARGEETEWPAMRSLCRQVVPSRVSHSTTRVSDDARPLRHPPLERKRETLFRAGDPHGGFFKIRSGVVAVSRQPWMTAAARSSPCVSRATVSATSTSTAGMPSKARR